MPVPLPAPSTPTPLPKHQRVFHLTMSSLFWKVNGQEDSVMSVKVVILISNKATTNTELKKILFLSLVSFSGMTTICHYALLDSPSPLAALYPTPGNDWGFVIVILGLGSFEFSILLMFLREYPLLNQSKQQRFNY